MFCVLLMWSEVIRRQVPEKMKKIGPPSVERDDLAWNQTIRGDICTNYGSDTKNSVFDKNKIAVNVGWNCSLIPGSIGTRYFALRFFVCFE